MNARPVALPDESGVPSPASLLERIRNRDHTRGSLLGSIVALSVPSLITMIGGAALFQLVDLHFIGRLGPDALASAGATNQTLRQAVFMMVIGVSVASQMLIARFVGAGRVDRAEHVAGQTLLLGVLLSAACAVVGLLFARPLVSLVARDTEVIALGTVFLRVAFALMFTQVLVQLGSSVLGGAGDATTPMFATLLITPVGVLGEWVLAFGHLGFPALGIAGIALGAALGGAVGLGVLTWALLAGRCRVHLRRHHLVPDAECLRQIVALSWQPALHMVARTFTIFFFMWLAGRLGGKVQAAYTIGLRLEMPAFMVAFTVANACATVVGQNLGAGRLDRTWRAIRLSYALELALLWPAAAILFSFRHALVALFADDVEVAAMAAEFLVFSSAVMLYYGLYFVTFRALQAAGDMNAPMIISVSVAGTIGLPIGYYLATQTALGATGMWIANLVYTMVNASLMITWLLRGGSIPAPGDSGARGA